MQKEPFLGDDGRYHFFYKTVNLKNWMYYYGVHSTDDLNDGYLGSGTDLTKAIDAEGKDNFSTSPLMFFYKASTAYEYEALLIDEREVNNPRSYNLAKGGRGGDLGKNRPHEWPKAFVKSGKLMIIENPEIKVLERLLKTLSTEKN